VSQYGWWITKKGSWGQFHRHFTRKCFVQKSFLCLEFEFERTFVQKCAQKNIDEIDTWSQFHQHFMSNCYARRSLPKVQKDTNDLSVFLHFRDLRMKKLCKNMLVKSTLGNSTGTYTGTPEYLLIAVFCNGLPFTAGWNVCGEGVLAVHDHGQGFTVVGFLKGGGSTDQHVQDDP